MNHFLSLITNYLKPAVRIQFEPTIISFVPHLQIAREAEAAMFHRQMFEELRRTSHLTRDPTETVAIGAVEASFKCCASAIIVLTKTGRYYSCPRWDFCLPGPGSSTMKQLL